MNYTEFIASKKLIETCSGVDVNKSDINTMLFPFQKDIVKWALKRGRAAIWADCGLGKTPMQLEWARHINGNVLILAPLAVSQQTIREGQKFGIDVSYCRDQKEVQLGITITNYEMLEHFNPSYFEGVVLDESSILKNYSGKIRNMIISSFVDTPYKLACTATPAPNDYMELGNHSEFIGVMSRTEMLSMFFVHDGGETSKWRLKRHAESKFWEWLASWAVVLRKPSDLRYEDNGFILPELNICQIRTESQNNGDFLFPMEALTLQERLTARRYSITERVQSTANMVNGSKDIWLIWCNLNDESAMLAELIPDAVEVKGSDSIEHKEKAIMDFVNGNVRVLISKPRICGFGMNFQHCHNMAFVGLSDSYEQFYQAVRRCWRFGQLMEVDCYVVTSDTEGEVVRNIERKECDSNRMIDNMVVHMHKINEINVKGIQKVIPKYEPRKEEGDRWTLYIGDCVEAMQEIENDSIHYSIFSPPFASLYTYSDSDRDMGNSGSYDEFFVHMKFLIKELHRVLKPGRLLSFHCMDIPLMKERDGVIGLRDFPGHLIQTFIDEGFIYHGKHIIWKDPLIEATRTNAIGLMHKQLCKDSSRVRSGLPDYLITMRKDGDNEEPIKHGEGLDTFYGENEPIRGVLSHERWRRYASPVWMDINQSDTLQHRTAREEKDERHICPLQLDIIRRGLHLYTNEGDMVLSPFAGIGSEGYVALGMGRQFVGIELKESYAKQAINNLKTVKRQGILI